MRALLDVNDWLAPLDDSHVFAPRANQWFGREEPAVATCPLTENGAVRILSTPSHSRERVVSPSAEARHLAKVCSKMDHEFWPDDVSLRDDRIFDVTRLHGPRQITDAYLLALAIAHGGRFVTLDDAIPLSAVRGATKKHLLVL